MLASVEPRSRPTPAGFQLLKMDGPNGDAELGKLAKGLRCGMDPARSRESNVEFVEDELSIGSRPGEGVLLKGLWVGVTRAELEAKLGTPRRPGFPERPGGNREGTVPARARRV
jgi:hypothetical protein